jgi:parallel beta-helix repeat protein
MVRGVEIGIDANSGSTDCLVDGNTFYGIRNFGIRMWGSGHVVSNNLVPECQNVVFYNQTGLDVVFKNNTGNSVATSGFGKAIFNDTGTVWAESNHITSTRTHPVQCYGAGAVLTMKNNYFGIPAVGAPITQEVSGGKIRVFGHVSGETAFGLHDVLEPGTNFSPAMRFISVESVSALTLRVKLLKNTGTQDTISFAVFWSSRETAQARGGFFTISFGSSNSYNDAPVLAQMGSTVTPETVAYDASGYPYWDFSMATNNYVSQALVFAVGQAVHLELYSVYSVN